MSETNPPIQPALDALQELKADIKKRVGKEGGNLNQLMLQKINTVEGVLYQIPTLQSMVNVINQQSQLATSTIRNMSRMLQGPDRKELANGTEGPSTTKGE